MCVQWVCRCSIYLVYLYPLGFCHFFHVLHKLSKFPLFIYICRPNFNVTTEKFNLSGGLKYKLYSWPVSEKNLTSVYIKIYLTFNTWSCFLCFLLKWDWFLSLNSLIYTGSHIYHIISKLYLLSQVRNWVLHMFQKRFID